VNKFVLLLPLQPSMFNIEKDDIGEMISGLKDVGLDVILVDGGKEMSFFASSTDKALLEQLCTVYDLGGVLVESVAVYDQVVQTEVFSLQKY